MIFMICQDPTKIVVLTCEPIRSSIDRMVDIGDLVAMIRTKRERISELEAELARLRAEIAAAVTELAPDISYAGRMPRSSAAGNTVKWAEDVLHEAGQPLHVSELLSRIERKHGHPVRYTTLVSNLSRLVKTGRTFYRAAPNVFGLLEQREKEVTG